ncbi:MAG: hypothetical protein JNJ80_00140, partial [Gemmatimonadetes bacterium]|nr:hypothetical protein [Gemmatimonadota bacterium]
MRRGTALLSFVAVVLSTPVAGQDSAKAASPTIPAKWDVLAKHGPTQDITFETSEGTWMSVDVS